jgi:hypothetical protein
LRPRWPCGVAVPVASADRAARQSPDTGSGFGRFSDMWDTLRVPTLASGKPSSQQLSKARATIAVER